HTRGRRVQPPARHSSHGGHPRRQNRPAAGCPGRSMASAVPRAARSGPDRGASAANAGAAPPLPERLRTHARPPVLGNDACGGDRADRHLREAGTAVPSAHAGGAQRPAQLGLPLIDMPFFTGLRCRMCGTGFPAEALFVCDQCLGPLEVTYDYDAIGRAVTREQVSARPENLWRYRELLPVTEPRTGFHSGFTPLIKADRLARRLGVRELYVKDDSVNHPTFSYKDRVVSVAATRAIELGFDVFACASTGNLANSVAAHAARLGLTCYVFIPDNLEAAKVMGS